MRAFAMTKTGPNPGRRWQWIWPVILAGLIVAASHQSTVTGPQIPHLDKLIHFSVYGLLATLICRLGHGWRAAAWALMLASAFGATDEWHQSFVPGRSSEVADWLADTLGAAVAVLLYRGWPGYRRRLEWSVLRNRRIEKSNPADSNSTP